MKNITIALFGLLSTSAFAQLPVETRLASLEARVAQLEAKSANPRIYCTCSESYSPGMYQLQVRKIDVAKNSDDFMRMLSAHGPVGNQSGHAVCMSALDQTPLCRQ